MKNTESTQPTTEAYPRPIATPVSLPVASIGEHIRREASYLNCHDAVSLVRTIDGHRIRITLERLT